MIIIIIIIIIILVSLKQSFSTQQAWSYKRQKYKRQFSIGYM